MLAVIQRVNKSSVSINGKNIGKIGKGLLVLLGVAGDDKKADADFMAEKIVNLRIFEDENQKMNLSLIDTKGAMLVISQFTLLGDCRKGRRPSFFRAASPDIANELYERFINQVRKKGINVETGKFGAMMDVELINDGPVTIIVESP